MTEEVLGGHGTDLSGHKEIIKDGKLIGYIGLEDVIGEEGDDFDRALGIGDFMILERGKGYGTEVIKDLIEKNKDKYDLIYCFVEANNTGAIKLYKTLGTVYDEDGPNDNGQYYVIFYDKTEIEEAFNKGDIYSMPNFNLNLYEALDELDTLLEDEQVAQESAVETINELTDTNYNDLNYIISNRGKTLNEKATQHIRKFAEEVCDKLHCSRQKWTYELQLLCNAYITEQTLELAWASNDDEIRSTVAEILDTARTEYNDIAFNALPGNITYGGKQGQQSHTQIINDDDTSSMDFITVEGAAGEANGVEIKATTNSKKLPANTNTHGADIVITFLLDRVIKAHSRRSVFICFRRERGNYTEQYPLEGYQIPESAIKPIRIQTASLHISNFGEKTYDVNNSELAESIQII